MIYRPRGTSITRFEENQTQIQLANNKIEKLENIHNLLINSNNEMGKYINYFLQHFSPENSPIKKLLTSSLIPNKAKEFLNSFIKDNMTLSLFPHYRLATSESFSIYFSSKILECAHEEEVKEKLRGVDLTSPDTKGISILHSTLINPKLKGFMISALLSNIGNIHTFLESIDEISKKTTMHIAITIGLLDVFKLSINNQSFSRNDLFMKMNDIKFSKSLHKTPLNYLIQSNRSEILRFILGEKDDILNDECLRILIKEVVTTDILNDFKNIIEQIYLSVNGRKKNGEINASDVIKFLQKRIYNVKNLQNEHPIVQASEFGYKNIFEYLIKGINPDFITSDGKSILHILCENGHADLIRTYRKSHLGKSESYSKLLTLKDIYGNTAIHYAAQYGNIELMKKLFKKLKSSESFAIANITNFNNATAIHFAIYYQNAGVVDFLLKMGASPTIEANSVCNLKGPFDSYELFFATTTIKSTFDPDYQKIRNALMDYQIQNAIETILNQFDENRNKLVSLDNWKIFRNVIKEFLNSSNNFKSTLLLNFTKGNELINYSQKISTRLASQFNAKHWQNKKLLKDQNRIQINQAIESCINNAIDEFKSSDNSVDHHEPSHLKISDSLYHIKRNYPNVKLFYNELLYLLSSGYGISYEIASGNLEKVSGTLANEIVIQIIAEIIGITANLIGEALKAASLPLMAVNPAVSTATSAIGNATSGSSGAVSTLVTLILNYHDQSVKETFRKKASNFIRSLMGSDTINKDSVDHERINTIVTTLTVAFLPMLEKLEKKEEPTGLARLLFARIFYSFSSDSSESDENCSEMISRNVNNIVRFFKNQSTIDAPVKKIQNRCLYAVLHYRLKSETENKFHFDREKINKIFYIGDVISQTAILVPKNIENPSDGYNIYVPKDKNFFDRTQLLFENFGGLMLDQDTAEKYYNYRIDHILNYEGTDNTLLGRFNRLNSTKEDNSIIDIKHQFIDESGKRMHLNEFLMHFAVLVECKNGVDVYLPDNPESANRAKQIISIFGFHLLSKSAIPRGFIRDESLSLKYSNLFNHANSQLTADMQPHGLDNNNSSVQWLNRN